jgi:hypothetical protein
LDGYHVGVAEIFREMVQDDRQTFLNDIRNLRNSGLDDLKQLRSRERIKEK